MPRSPSVDQSVVIAPRYRHSTGADEKIAIDWCYRDGSAQGQLTPDSPDEAWQALVRRCAQTPATLLLPADTVSHFHLAAPRGLKRSEWPLLLEEVSSDNAQTLHLHALQRGRGHLELVALSSDELHRWQTWAHTLQLTLAGWSVAFMALEVPDQNDEAATLDDGEYRLFKGRGEPVTPAGPTCVEWLAWPRAWSAPPGWQERHWLEAVAHEESASNEAVRTQSLAWVATRLPAPLPFSGSSARGRSINRVGRLTALLPGRHARLTAVALAVLIAVNGALWLATQMVEGNRQAQHSKASLAMRFTGEVPSAVLDQLADRRDAIDALAQRNHRLKEALSHITPLLDERQWQLSRQAINGQQVVLSWRPPGPPAQVEITQANQRLSPIGETRWQAEQGELTLSFALDRVAPEGLEPEGLEQEGLEQQGQMEREEQDPLNE